MFIAKRRPTRHALCVGGLALAAAGPPARADVVFGVVDPTRNGVFASTNTTADFAPATDNPARAAVDGARASLRLIDSELRFSADVVGFAGDSFIASTGVGPQSSSDYGAIPVQIIGTAGEANGAPVSITLSSLYNGPGGADITQLINGASYPVNASSTLSGLKIGDTLIFWGLLGIEGAANASLMSTLTVVPLQDTPAVPEPGAPALLAGGAALLLACRRAAARPRGRRPSRKAGG